MINITFKNQYVSSGLDRLPYGYIDKTLTGCGATSLAIENSDNTLLLVPSLPIIFNKITQYPNNRCNYKLFGVYGGINKEDIDEYVNMSNPIKIICTYDSLFKVREYLDLFDSIVIDECQRILKGCKIKTDNGSNSYLDMMDLLESYKDKLSFISATPLPTSYLPKWVDKLDKYKFIFTNTKKCIPYLIKVGYPKKYLLDNIIRPLEESGKFIITDKSGKSYFFKKVIVFVNSVSTIIDLCEDLNSKDVQYITGDTVRNDSLLNQYSRVTKPDSLTKYTFITSTGFEGIDLYDKEAITIVISTTDKSYKMIDMLTDLKQCVNRNRINSDRYIFIYNQNIYDKSKEELSSLLEETKNQITSNCELLNRKDDGWEYTLKTFQGNKLFNQYTIFKDDKWQLNELIYNSDKYFIEVISEQYQKGFDIIGKVLEYKPIIIKPIKGNSYFSIYEKYIKMLDNKYRFTNKEMNDENYKLIDSVFKKTNKLFKRKDRCLVYYSDKDDFSKIKDAVKTYKGRYTKTDIKSILKSIYKDNGLNRTPKITDLNEFGITYIEKKIKGYKYIDIV